MAGAGMRDIKRRIKSVNSTRQITKAMELVSSAKVIRAREKMDRYRPYFRAVSDVVGEVLGGDEIIVSDYVEGAREIKKTLYIVISGDRGLCGGYNSNIYKLFTTLDEGEESDTIVIPIGVKSVEYFTKRNYEILESYPGIGETITYEQAREIADKSRELYESGEVDEIYLVYTQFVSMISQKTTMERLLPMTPKEVEENVAKLAGEEEENESLLGGDKSALTEVTLFEPDQEKFFELFVPLYVESMVYGGIVEAFASEQAARRTAMENASDNAKEMIEQLELFYNRARQAAITQEITEIVGGANALQ
ncbi:MAG: ATP synthase F1 subunit gamma [Firmicutes bacterium]|jgi:F-type H+-transporting ATPase subunit gamma|nr:ATP synthase F1 subunit gamma [Bacillota bacterium]